MKPPAAFVECADCGAVLMDPWRWKVRDVLILCVICIADETARRAKGEA